MLHNWRLFIYLWKVKVLRRLVSDVWSPVTWQEHPLKKLELHVEELQHIVEQQSEIDPQ